ncbi:MAG: DUF2156 domain-containing protein [Desulfitobacteriia bacterium]|jgi:hypothetical protein
MINFKKIRLEDKEWIRTLLKSADMGGCHQNFTNLFTWSGFFGYRVARINDFLVVKGELEDNEKYYLYPAGTGDIKPVLESMFEDAEKSGHDFKLLGLSEDNREELSGLYPGFFKYEYMRNSSDYVYLLDKLINLKGNKLSSKRNHINFFKRHNKDNWSFELITADNLEECREMNKAWCLEHDCKDDIYLFSEYCAVRRCFDNFFELGLEGGLIRVGGKIVAFTMGEVLNSDTYVIHVEKAFDYVRGAYQMINREFAVYVREKYPHLTYMNREEDMGHEGLRKAKLSYRPDKMEDKYAAIPIRRLK